MRAFVDPKEIEHPKPMIHHRFRIVAPAFDEDQANRIAEKIGAFASCSIERFWAVTDNECTEVLGEAVLQRTMVPLHDREPAP